MGLRNRRALLLTTVLGGGAAPAVPWYELATFQAAYQPIGAASLATSYVNLVSPGTNDLTVPVGANAPALLAGGWGFAGGVATDCLRCGIAVSETSCFVARLSTNSSGGGSLGRLLEASGVNMYFYPFSASNLFGWQSGAGAAGTGTKITYAKVVILAGKDVYIDGVLTATAGAGAVSAASYVIGNNSSSFNRCMDGTVSHFAVAASLTPGEIAAITLAINP